MDTHRLIAMSFAVAALGLLLLALPMLQQWWRRRRTASTLDAALARVRHGRPAHDDACVPAGDRAREALSSDTQHAASPHGVAAPESGWLASPLGRAAVGTEEARLLEQCGYYGPKARATFGVARWLASLALAVTIGGWQLQSSVPRALMAGFGAFAVGFLAFKWVLRHRAARRLARIDEELPMLVDMLRLLQGVGMSIDQSLQLIVTEFGRMLPVLAPEIRRANDQFASGRSREQTLLRIGKLFDSHDLRNLVLLLTQVDRFGGAVQEPLRAFGLRLQEARKLRLKERVGRLTVKMTGVMVVSLLPVLLIVTAGPGFLGVIRMLGQFAGDMR